MIIATLFAAWGVAARAGVAGHSASTVATAAPITGARCAPYTPLARGPSRRAAGRGPGSEIPGARPVHRPRRQARSLRRGAPRRRTDGSSSCTIRTTTPARPTPRAASRRCRRRTPRSARSAGAARRRAFVSAAADRSRPGRAARRTSSASSARRRARRARRPSAPPARPWRREPRRASRSGPPTKSSATSRPTTARQDPRRCAR